MPLLDFKRYIKIFIGITKNPNWHTYFKIKIISGAVPIATMNLQHCGGENDIPDAWHHQMIFGVS